MGKLKNAIIDLLDEIEASLPFATNDAIADAASKVRKQLYKKMKAKEDTGLGLSSSDPMPDPCPGCGPACRCRTPFCGRNQHSDRWIKTSAGKLIPPVDLNAQAFRDARDPHSVV